MVVTGRSTFQRFRTGVLGSCLKDRLIEPRFWRKVLPISKLPGNPRTLHFHEERIFTARVAEIARQGSRTFIPMLPKRPHHCQVSVGSVLRRQKLNLCRTHQDLDRSAKR